MNDTGGHTHFLPDLRASQLAGTDPAPLEFIDGYQLFLKGELNYLSGVGAIGKTTLTLQLATSVALSQHLYEASSWLDRPVSVRGPVMFVSGEENANTLHLVLLDVCADQGIELRDLANLHIHDISGHDHKTLLTSAGRGKPVVRTPLFRAFEASIALLKPVLIVVDNRAQIANVDEIDRNSATAVGNIFRAVSAKYGTTVILLMHPSVSGEKDGRSGSTGWNNAGRNTVLMCKPKEVDEDADDDGKRELRVVKANRSQMGLRASLKWAAGVYRCTDKPERAGSDIGKAEKAERVFLKLLTLLMKRGQRVSANPKGTYAPTEFTKPGMDREGINKREFEAAMNRLIDTERVDFDVISPGTSREKRWLKPASGD